MAEQIKTFTARIKAGARIWTDFRSRQWTDETIQFTGRRVSAQQHFDLVAPGHGELGGNYGNGSVLIFSIDDMIIDAETRARLVAEMRADKQEKIAKAEADLAKLIAELDALV